MKTADEIIHQLAQAIDEMLGEFDDKPFDHEGPWFGRNDTAGTVLARDALEALERYERGEE
jgi:hypothetical protein